MSFVQVKEEPSFKEIENKLKTLMNTDSIDSISQINNLFSIRIDDTYGKQIIPDMLCKALIQKGSLGIQRLEEHINSELRYIYFSSIIRNLWMASIGNISDVLFYSSEFTKEVLCKKLNMDTIETAKEVFYSIIVKCMSDSDLFFSLNYALYGLFQFNNVTTKGLVKDIFEAISRSSLKLSKEIIREFEKLIDLEKKEEDYQKFLSSNPIFINPLSYEVFNKQKLGDDLITDFVVKTFQNEYLLVEIEKPQDKIFNNKGDFSAKFTHAYNQVLDFILWVDENISYAQKKMPNILSPNGILIMGRSIDLNEKQRLKIRCFNKNSTRIKVYTYDDILENANKLFLNLYSYS